MKLLLKKRRFLMILFMFYINIVLFCIPICADGQGNIDGGGHGQMGEGSHSNQWIPGDEGVRVTIVDTTTGTTMFNPVDLSNKSFEGRTEIYHFRKQCKLTYLTGAVNLSPLYGNYEAHVPDHSLPIIISSSTYGTSNPEVIKSYFTDNGTLTYIANLAGITFDELTGGNYRLVIEPIIYFYYTGKYYAMTAHEFFTMDMMTGGSLRTYFKTLAYKNLAYSMFLEYDELGVPAWTGGTSSAASIEQAFRYLGIGIVHFRDSTPPPPEEELKISSTPYVYRCDTDVITSITVSSSVDVTPDDPISVTFYINGDSYRVNGIVMPGGESQLVWCKWHTPSTPQNITGYAEISGRSYEVTIPIVIEELRENEPPDPKASDENGKPVQKPDNWREDEVEDAFREKGNHFDGYSTLSWGKWIAVAHTNVWYETYTYTDPETGEEYDEEEEHVEIYYTYEENRYYATVNGVLKLSADEKCPTAKNTSRGTIQIGSGYGVDALVSTYVNGTYNSGDITPIQNSIFYFPEFYYKTYWRLGEITNKGNNSSKLEFKHNRYSHFNTRTHFTPLWYPDAKDIYTDNYKMYVHMIDCWTPAGMLQCQSADAVQIDGTVYDDWRISEILD